MQGRPLPGPGPGEGGRPLGLGWQACAGGRQSGQWGPGYVLKVGLTKLDMGNERMGRVLCWPIHWHSLAKNSPWEGGMWLSETQLSIAVGWRLRDRSIKMGLQGIRSFPRHPQRQSGMTPLTDSARGHRVCAFLHGNVHNTEHKSFRCRGRSILQN